MAQQFFAVFPELRLEGELESLMQETQVLRVSMTRKKDLLRIYMESNVWIHKKYIYQLEEAIRAQFFSGTGLRVKILEKFRLSRQYTVKNLMEVYRSSIELELKKYSVFLYHVFQSAALEFPAQDEMTLILDDSAMAHNCEEELIRILEKIVCERCGLSMKLSVSFRKLNKAEKYAQKNEYQMKEQARHIVARSAIGQKLIQNGDLKPQHLSAPSVSGETLITADISAASKEITAAVPAAPKDSKERHSGRAAAKSGKRGGNHGTDDVMKKSSNPDVLYGRDFEDEAVTIVSLGDDLGDVTVRGRILNVEPREIRNARTILMFTLTDETDTISSKIFLSNDDAKEIQKDIKPGAFIKLKGKTVLDSFDHDLTIMSVWGIKKIADFREKRTDTYPSKRVELHCHSKMSDMDAVTDASVLVKRAFEWGHPAIAITDHGVVQAFPEANHAMEAIDGAWRQKYKEEHPEATKEELKKVSAPFKVIYGCEAYLVDDTVDMIRNSHGQGMDDTYVVFDIETTGFSPIVNTIIEIGAVKVVKGEIRERYSTFVNPRIPIPYRITELTSIRDDMVMDAPDIETVLPDFLKFCEGAVMVAHNASFDMSFIEHLAEKQGILREFTVADTMTMARFLLPGLSRFKLDTVAKAVGVVLDHHHRAVDDAECTAHIFMKFLTMCRDRDIMNLDQLNAEGHISEENIRKLPSHHAIILAKNETGRVNLYRCVSESHLKYYNRRPLLPKSFYLAHKDGLMIGSACEAGELYQALLRGVNDGEIARLVDFYDYLEIQPLDNNRFMIEKEDVSAVNSEEDLKEINRRIVKLGEQFHKPVVATCDVHFIDPQDEIYRRIIMAGKGFEDADKQAPLYLRTTEEMLEEFSYLGSQKAEEVVITNPNLIAGMVEKISPIRAGKFPPVIEDSDKTLRRICYDSAHEMYGPNLPKIVEDRLERELNSIISNGYAVMYIIAQKLVWKSVEDGYLVGSRGSVGSSFVATMAGITEVNPLSPHYLCGNCYYVEFDSERVKAYAGRSGCDMPDAICPKCGKPLKKCGFDIPFETFLGFKGNKEPDIDLNFSGEYQSKAHKYTEVIFGAGQTFRAGTIGTLADKTAFGYVKNYYEDHGIHKRNCEIDRIVQGCTGVRRTTGQHPGGIIVLPFGEDINSFTPVQHPANDMNTDIITTHFDYHSIDSNLLKLDILGHDDPTMIRMLEDITGLDATTVPLDNPEVMSLFKGTEALGITPDDIGGCPLGCLGVPEFGTDFAMQMLLDTKPQSFSDLVRIAGLAHGTDVWLGNAETLIKEGKCTISTAICTRDDIMIYLIGKGLESELSFTIMEAVRKGKGLKPEWEKEMRAHDVPDWYIWSCKKIKYMFPKAHAAAYVMMAYRIAYYKIFYPLAYYASFFSIRASAFSYELMCMGRERLDRYLSEYQSRESPTQKEKDAIRDMRIVQEMYARGFDFVPVDLYKAQAHRFTVIDEKHLMPALDSIEGLGDKAADAVVLAARDGKFLSRDDFRDRTKVSKSVIDFMNDLGIFGDLPETNQFSLFDFDPAM